MPWITPTGHIDEGNNYTYPEYAWDDNTITFASDVANLSNWTATLILTHSAIICDIIRFWAVFGTGLGNLIDVDVQKPDDSWVDVFHGTWDEGEYFEQSIPNGPFSIKAIRLKGYNGFFFPLAFNIHEVDFGEVVPVYAASPLVGSKLIRNPLISRGLVA